MKARVTTSWNATLLSIGKKLILDRILIDQEVYKLIDVQFDCIFCTMLVYKLLVLMHGVINKIYMEKFKPLLEKGNVYIITNVRVMEQNRCIA
jgi:hypothetical protein